MVKKASTKVNKEKTDSKDRVFFKRGAVFESAS